MPDLWLTCDHFVGKVSAMSQPTRPTQPSIPLGSVNSNSRNGLLLMDYGAETIKRQTKSAYGCFVAGQSPWERAYPMAYRLYARTLCSCGLWRYISVICLCRCLSQG